MTKTQPKRLASLILFLLSLAGLLTAAEISAKIYLEHVLEKAHSLKYQFDSYRVFSHRPGFKEGRDGKNWIVINSQGFRRTEEVQKQKPAGTFRAFLLGGSAAHGISSSRPYPVRHIFPDQTIDAYLEKWLRQKYPGKNVEIINAAVSGYQVFQHTQYLLSELLDYDPDLVIFFDGYNDHFVSNPDYDPYRDYHYQFWKDKLQDPSLGGLFDYFALWMSNYSTLARGFFSMEMQRQCFSHKMKNKMALDWESSEKTVAKHREAADRLFLRSVDINLLLLKEFGIDAVICFQPMLSLRDESLLSGQERSWERSGPVSHQALYPVII